MKINYQVDRSIGDVYASLSDFGKFGALHPYITKVEKTDGDYRVEEVVPMWGFLKIRNVYHVRVNALPNSREIVYTSQIKPSVAVRIIWRLTEKNGSTIEEEIHIQANPVVRYILGTVMKNAHQKVIDRLNKN